MPIAVLPIVAHPPTRPTPVAPSPHTELKDMVVCEDNQGVLDSLATFYKLGDALSPSKVRRASSWVNETIGRVAAA